MTIVENMDEEPATARLPITVSIVPRIPFLLCYSEDGTPHLSEP